VKGSSLSVSSPPLGRAEQSITEILVSSSPGIFLPHSCVEAGNDKSWTDTREEVIGFIKVGIVVRNERVEVDASLEELLEAGCWTRMLGELS
jgi:hypothetical protein